jgi:hypothetical protein
MRIMFHVQSTVEEDINYDNPPSGRHFVIHVPPTEKNKFSKLVLCAVNKAFGKT